MTSARGVPGARATRTLVPMRRTRFSRSARFSLRFRLRSAPSPGGGGVSGGSRKELSLWGPRTVDTGDSSLTTVGGSLAPGFFSGSAARAAAR